MDFEEIVDEDVAMMEAAAVEAEVEAEGDDGWEPWDEDEGDWEQWGPREGEE